jgi:hypothetical protein
MSGRDTETARDHRQPRYEESVDISPEFALLASCCRWNFPGGDRRKPAATKPVDWPRFLRLARFHRVQGLSWRAIHGSKIPLPVEIAEALSTDASGIAAANLRAAAESKRLLASFAKAGLPLLFLKGLTLGQLAYGDASAKSGIDIDLLVASDRLEASAEQLRAREYRRLVPNGSGGLRRWHATRKESLWTKEGTNLAVDLHTRLADNPRLIAGIGVDSSLRTIDIGNGISLPTLGHDELFAYLAVHGASSAWFRLKWISDLAALVSPLDPAEIVRLYTRSQILGAGRPAGQALLLADRLFGTLDQLSDLRDELRRDRSTERLYRAALAQLAGRPEPIEPTSRPLGTWTIHWTQFRLAPGAGFQWSELVRQARLLLP